MRLNLNFVNSHFVYQLELGGIARILHNSFDIVVVELPDGTSAAIHLVERDIDVGLIKDTLAYNAARQQATLFILWAPMLLPDNGMRYRPYDWMDALITLYDDKIYGFEMFNSSLYVFPVYFDRMATGIDRMIRWGDRVDMTYFRTEKIHADGRFVNGYWHIADMLPPRQRNGDPAADAPASDARNPLHVFFDVLGVPHDADWDAVKHAYRQLARQYHPDVSAAPDAHDHMQRINTAYQRLGEIFGGSES
jgi:hypothetical protein